MAVRPRSSVSKHEYFCLPPPTGAVGVGSAQERLRQRWLGSVSKETVACETQDGPHPSQPQPRARPTYLDRALGPNWPAFAELLLTRASSFSLQYTPFASTRALRFHSSSGCCLPPPGIEHAPESRRLQPSVCLHPSSPSLRDIHSWVGPCVANCKVALFLSTPTQPLAQLDFNCTEHRLHRRRQWAPNAPSLVFIIGYLQPPSPNTALHCPLTVRAAPRRFRSPTAQIAPLRYIVHPLLTSPCKTSP